jgi:hypothetical protein
MKKHATDAEISIRLKERLVAMLENEKNPSVVVALVTAYAKLRAVELKQEEGDWGDDLPTEEVRPVDVRTVNDR